MIRTATPVCLGDSLGFVTNRIAYLMRKQFADWAAASGIGLTPEEWIVLATLAEHGPAGQSQLAELLMRDRTTVTRLLDGLVRRRLAQREHAQHDRRVVTTSLTAEGLALADKVMPAAAELRRVQTEGIPDDELEVTFRTLERVRANLCANGHTEHCQLGPHDPPDRR